MIMHHRFTLAVTIMFGLAPFTTEAAAQFPDVRPSTKGFFLKASASASDFRSDSINTHAERGLAIAFGMGIGFSRYVALAFDGSDLFYRRGQANRYHTGVYDIGLRLHWFREDARVIPYADAMVAALFLYKDSLPPEQVPAGKSLAGKSELDCSCWTAGAGVLYFVTSKLAIDGSAHFTHGNFKTTPPGVLGKPTVIFPATAMRVNLGLAFYGGPSPIHR
jgi:hypothetical protein